MKAKIMYAVEHYNKHYNTSTFEVFATLREAKIFCNKILGDENYYPLYIFKALFNHVYKQEDGSWNYDDYSDTILKYYDFEIQINPIPEYCNE